MLEEHHYIYLFYIQVDFLSILDNFVTFLCSSFVNITLFKIFKWLPQQLLLTIGKNTNNSERSNSIIRW